MSNRNLSNQSFFEYLFYYFNENFAEMSENIANLIFYYIFCKSSLDKMSILDFDLVKFEEILKNSNQKNLVKFVNANNLASIKSFDYNCFEGSFGSDCKYFFYLFF